MSSSPRWYSHWWRYDASSRAMIHRSSGETVIYRGMIDGAQMSVSSSSLGRHSTSTDDHPSRHRFDYASDDGHFPLVVEMKRVEYFDRGYVPTSTHSPGFQPGPVKRPWVWRIDYERSSDLWRQDSPSSASHPPYWLWKRADVALCDAAMQWFMPAEIQHADEIAANGGWGNGRWEREYYRRFRKGYPAKPLPIEDYTITAVGEHASEWRCKTGFGLSIDGRKLSTPVTVWENSADGAEFLKIASQQDDKRSIVGHVRHGEFVTYALYVSSQPDFLDIANSVATAAPGPNWSMNRLTRSKPCENRGEQNSGSGGSLDNASNKEYEVDRLVTEIASHLLPFCTGLEDNVCDASTRQGDVGRVSAVPATICSIRSAQLEVRLKLSLPTDSPETDWRRFF